MKPFPSLLLGLDKERRQIACGLVDTIGTVVFNIAQCVLTVPWPV